MTRPLMLAAALLAIAPEHSVAQGFEVAPVLLELPAGQMATTLFVTNNNPQPSTIQTRTFAWHQENGVDLLVDTQDLVASPPIVSVGPGTKQVIRLVLRRKATPGHEDAYRVLLDQLRPAGEPGTVQVALRLSIPVFAQPATATAPRLVWRVSRHPDGLQLIAENTGGRRERVLEITDPTTGERLTAMPESASTYILPGSSQRWLWRHPDLAPAGSAVTGLKLRTPEGLSPLSLPPVGGR